jgi:hypothetical protein
MIAYWRVLCSYCVTLIIGVKQTKSSGTQHTLLMIAISFWCFVCVDISWKWVWARRSMRCYISISRAAVSHRTFVEITGSIRGIWIINHNKSSSRSCTTTRGRVQYMCYAMLCYAVLRHAMIWYAMICYEMLCYEMLCYAMLWDAMICYAMICHATLCCDIHCYYSSLCQSTIYSPNFIFLVQVYVFVLHCWVPTSGFKLLIMNDLLLLDPKYMQGAQSHDGSL